MKDIIIYEQPLNEIIRACIRIEQLFIQLDHQLQDHTELGTRNAIMLIINLLQLLDRPDLKAKLAKELSIQLTNLMRYDDVKAVDSKKLQHLIQQLEEHSRTLIDSSGKIGHRLREMELLNALRLPFSSPGGGCSFDVPLLHYWLNQPAKIRANTLNDWISDFDQIRTVITLLLDLVRKNTKIEYKTAIHGFHQELLDPQLNLRMICIGIKADIATYPEVSIGRHFLSVRFYVPDILKRPSQYPDNISFSITYCHA